MAASIVSGGSYDDGEESRSSLRGSSPMEASKVDDCRPEVKQDELAPLDDSVVSTPKASSKGNASRRTSESDESAMDYTPSPSSDNAAESADASPKAQTTKQPVVSHIPASVQQPVLPASEQSSLASLAPQNYGIQIQQPQTFQESKVTSAAPTFQVIHGTQGQVVKKQKGRFRLLQNAPITTDGDSVTTGTNTCVPTAAGDAYAPDASISQPPAIVTTVEGGLPTITHPSHERNLSNASTLSAKSAQNQTIAGTNVLQTESPAKAAPVVKKKGRFVVIPGDVTDPSLLGRVPRDGARQVTPTGQPFSGQQQHVLRQQTIQPVTATEQVVGTIPQSTAASFQPMPSQDVVPQVQIGESQPYQVPVNIPQTTQSIAGSIQYHQQQVAVPQYYAAAPQGALQVVQVNFPQQQLQNVPVGTPMQPRTSSPPVPPSTQPTQSYAHQQHVQPPAQMWVSSEVPSTYVVQTEDGRLHQVVAATQQMVTGPHHMVPIPEHSCTSGLIAQQAAIPQETSLPQHLPVQFQSAAPVPQTNLADAAKAPQATKPAALKKPTVQRATSGKGATSNVGFGKVLYYLEQMKLEVTEADRTIKNHAKDMKFLREKNKELEARSRDMERKWLEEKAAREALEAKVKSLKKKASEQKGSMEAQDGSRMKEADDNKLTEAAEPTKPQSRSSSIDDETVNGPEKAAVIASETLQATETKGYGAELPTSHAVVSEPDKSVTVEEGVTAVCSASTERREAGRRTAEVKPMSPPRFNDSPESTGQPKASVPRKESTPSNPPASLEIPRRSSGDVHESRSANTSKLVTETPQAAHCRKESTSGAEGDKPSPTRRRSSKDVAAEKLTAGKTSSVRSLKSQAVPTIACPSGGHGSVKPIAMSSGDSFGSVSDFDPLRVGHGNVHGDGTISTASEPLPPGQTAFTSGISSVSFDPLAVSHQSHKVPDMLVPSIVVGSMQPAHNQSQSMPNFVLCPNNMMMAYPVQQVDMNMASSSSLSHMHQSWNPQQQQQSLPNQNQYLSSQYSSTNVSTSSLQSHHQYPGVQAVAQQPRLSHPSADPFDELASRRAPGTAGQCGLQQQQEQQSQENWTNQPP